MFTNEHYELLGLKAKDAVTGFHGVITTVSFDLYGCVQAIVTPPVDGKGEMPDSRWFDVTRLIIQNRKPVMQRPDFQEGYIAEGRKGCSDKPLPGA
jgi:hypothetical protein